MISTWNIKKFSRCKIFLHENGQSNPNHNLWNHFSDANLSIIFLLNNIRNDNYGTLRVIRKDYQNVLETICLTKQNIEILNFKLLKKDNLIGIQYKTEDEEMIMQFVFFNNNDSLSFFTFLSPYMPYEILPDDYKVVEETVTSQNITSSFSTFSSPIHSTNASMENQVLSLVDKSNKIMNESQIHATATFENQQVKHSLISQNNSDAPSNSTYNKSDNLNNEHSKAQTNSISQTIAPLLKQQDINTQIQYYLNLQDYQLLRNIYEILDNSSFAELVEKIDDLYSSYISE